MRPRLEGLSDASPGKIFFVAWLVIVTLYVGYGEFRKISANVVQAYYRRGGADAASQLIKQSVGCQQVPVTLNGEKMTFVDISCLSKNE